MISLEKVYDSIDFDGYYQIGRYQIKKSTVYLIAIGGIAALMFAPPTKGF